MPFLIYIFIVVMLGILTSQIAKNRGGNQVGWFIFGVLIPIVAIPLAFTVKPSGRNQPTRACPYCSARVPKGEMQCPKCNRSQPNINAATVSSWEQTIARNDESEKWNQPPK